jgi:hypothetical protein
MIYLGLFLSLLVPLILFLIWLLLLINFFRSWFFRLVPPVARQYIKNRLKVDYQPYQPAIRSLRSMLWEMLKIAGLVFVTALLILILVYGPVAMPSIFHRP